MFGKVRIFSALAVCMAATSGAWANHPVLVEGNCDSPVPGTTIVNQGTCGDFDGDGRIGTAEDTDGADRIFGTLKAALGPGTGAAAGTGANYNGTITIVTSGRFAEVLAVTPTIVANPGNITIKAAPGVEAQLDAVLQGDPAGNNTSRQNDIGILIQTPSNRRVSLENLTIRNYNYGIVIVGSSVVSIVNCRVTNNLNMGISVQEAAALAIDQSYVANNGYRIGGPSSTANPGAGIYFQGGSNGSVTRSFVTLNAGFGVHDASSGAVTITDSYVTFNQPDF